MSASSTSNTGFGGGYASNINMNTTATSGGYQQKKNHHGAMASSNNLRKPGASPVNNIMSSESNTNLSSSYNPGTNQQSKYDNRSSS
jgi:hypothetical protein